jgi:hypothetical protein
MSKPVKVYSVHISRYGIEDYKPFMFYYNFRLANKLAKTIILHRQEYAWVRVDYEYNPPSRKIRKKQNKFCKKLIKHLEAIKNV